MTRAEAKQQEPSMEGMRVSLEKETGIKLTNSGEVQSRKGSQPLYMGGGSRYSLIPPGEKPEVIRHKVLQSLLAIFLGTFGAHKFYQGKTFQGALYCLFCWTTLPGFIGFCEGIRYMCMKMDDFYLDYYLERRKDDRHGRH